MTEREGQILPLRPHRRRMIFGQALHRRLRRLHRLRRENGRVGVVVVVVDVDVDVDVVLVGDAVAVFAAVGVMRAVVVVVVVVGKSLHRHHLGS